MQLNTYDGLLAANQTFCSLLRHAIALEAVVVADVTHSLYGHVTDRS